LLLGFFALDVERLAVQVIDAPRIAYISVFLKPCASKARCLDGVIKRFGGNFRTLLKGFSNC
jgi:hypothetical protein